MITNFILIFTVVVFLAALIIIKNSLKGKEARVAVNFKAMIVHFVAFAIYAATTIYLTVVLILSNISKKNPTVDARDLNQIIEGIVSQCVSSSILAFIFVKIYTVVRVREENNAEEDEESPFSSYSSMN